MKKIGLMGGTFDPIHLGHLMIGQQAQEEYGLDEVWYMPSRIPPHKKDHKITSAQDRCAMVQAAIAPYPGFVFSDFELKRTEGNTYTADTMRLLKEEYPEYEFYFIVGADSIHDIEKWYHPEYVLKEVCFLAADREYENPIRSLEDQIAYLTKKYNARIYRLHCRMMNIASAEIRERLAGNQPVEDLIPESVLTYIREHDLYRQ
ncbi:MAG: nicotinate-nucleotide adenylyltransferase [Clostridium sp.]|nr:nicotinate-nucleotide adenylyltransferase [Clostridium sp.]